MKLTSLDGPRGPCNTTTVVARQVNLRGTVGQIRAGRYEDRDYLVVPVVALVESVVQAMNAEHPEFVPVSCLTGAPQGWNGRPVMLGHPTNAGHQISANTPTVLEAQSFGMVFGSRVDGKRLLMEAWIDPLKAEKVGASRMLERLQAGEAIEVSVGAFVVTENIPGVHGGKPYKAVWRDVLPDHLAFLPNGVGACSVEMGCGARAAGAVEDTDDEFTDDDAVPPDGYAIALQAMRAGDDPEAVGFYRPTDRRTEQRRECEQLQQMADFRKQFLEIKFASLAASLQPATGDVYLMPPDPYAEGLKALRERDKC